MQHSTTQHTKYTVDKVKKHHGTTVQSAEVKTDIIQDGPKK